MAKRDYYEILGLSKSASPDDIKRAHRKLVRQYHPDVNKNNKSAEEKFKEVQEAYDVLSDESKRKQYDQFGHAGMNGGGGDPFDSFRRGAGGRASWNAGSGTTVEDFDPRDFGGGNNDFGDIFEQFFGRGGGAYAGRAPRGRVRTPAEPPPVERGADIEHSITLSFEQASRGVTLPLQISRDGKLETIDVRIPAGVKDGSKVRLRGKGQHVHGGPPGDLYIITSVRPHEVFRRDDLDVLVELPVSAFDAILGTKVSVPTLDGQVTITIPPGTNSGAKLRIKGRGVYRGDDKGDQLCVVKLVVPKTLEPDDRQTIEALRDRYPGTPKT